MTTTKTILTPDTANIGDGATVHYWSDSSAATIIDVKRNGKQIVLQFDRATRANSDDDVVHVGGFAAHREHPNGQKWNLERDPDGEICEANWSEKRQRFCVGGAKGNPVSAGRRHFYDYNF